MPLHKQQQGCNNKPTLVFLHGFLGSSSDWLETINLLKDDFHCISIDLPGHGASVATASSLKDGFNHCHRLIKDALDDLNIQQYTLIGYSLGGRIALDYARTQNDKRLKALLLESSHTGLNDVQAKERRFMQDHSWAKKFATQSIIESLYEWYDQDIFSDLTDGKKEMIIGKRADNYGVSLANMLLATSLGKQTDALAYLQKTDLAVHYCFGGKDKKFKNVSAQLNNLKHVNVIEFEKAGHNIHQHDAHHFALYILQNLK
ncbi:MAG: 2-succinyl-6-hydroxy-2,4-cyclohexadiene-1-carboxylate synthase [Psychromonas sp.]|nr:2-succinyl-6-hydroxy-2,4-cyclohexadiene-1-carboxylate synthase [Alteromonadales bacterium]MCP5079939.1 2-succinyl-6-hydroxy-2,4-cyclohexadiene-1-carboxylate synthase [Psychromonas sp.]